MDIYIDYDRLNELDATLKEKLDYTTMVAKAQRQNLPGFGLRQRGTVHHRKID